MKPAKDDAVRQLANKLQAILGYLELEEHDKAIKVAKETLAHLHRIKAVRSAKATVRNLNQMVAALSGSPVMLPKNGSVIVVPHGSRVVSHEDVNVDVNSDEVRVVGPSSVRSGHGTHNAKTK